MSKPKKKALIIAVCCIAAGFILAAVALAMVNFDFSKLSTVRFQTVTYQVEEPFTALDVQATDCNISLVPSTDGACRVVSAEAENISHTVAVENGTLMIKRVDNRKWYERIGMYWGDISLTIYLPEGTYTVLKAVSASGNITVQQAVTFQQAEISTSSGDISVDGTVQNGIKAKTESGNLSICNQSGGVLDVQSTSGNISLSNLKVDTLTARSVSGDMHLQAVEAEQDLFLESASGNLTAEKVSGTDMTAQSSSGNIVFTNVVMQGGMTLETASGDIRFTGSDAEHLQLNSASGNIVGSLLSDKQFSLQTASGDISVPDSVPSAGMCEAATSSGNIQITIQH